MSSRVLPEDTLNNNTERVWDSLLGNLPYLAFFMFVCSTISTSIIYSEMNVTSLILDKYNETYTPWVLYSKLMLGGLLLLHFAVLMHSFSVTILETSRERYKVGEIGFYACCCKDKSTVWGRKCRTFQSCMQTLTKYCWGVCGTLCLTIAYIGNIGMSTVSSLSTLMSYLMLKTCDRYTNVLNNTIQNAKEKLVLAKGYVGKADNVTKQFLYEYNRWMQWQNSLQHVAFEEIGKIETPTYVQPKWKVEHARYLEKSDLFDPTYAIAEGNSIIQTLNQTILHTQQYVVKYEGLFYRTVLFCRDYSSIYSSLFIIATCALVLLLCHLLSFSIHMKSFTAWYYESRLLKEKIWK